MSSNEYKQHMFLWRSKKKYFLDAPLIYSYEICSSDYKKIQTYVLITMLKKTTKTIIVEIKLFLNDSSVQLNCHTI